MSTNQEGDEGGGSVHFVLGDGEDGPEPEPEPELEHEGEAHDHFPDDNNHIPNHLTNGNHVTEPQPQPPTPGFGIGDRRARLK